MSLTKEKIHKYTDFWLFLLFFLFMQVLYKTFVCPYFYYFGFEYVFDLKRFVIANIAFLLLAYANTKNTGFGYFVGSLFLILIFVPNSIMFAFMPQYQIKLYAVVLTFQTFLILLLQVRLTSKKIKMPVLDKDSKIMLIFIISIIALFPFFLKFRLNLDFKVFLFQDIYLIRKQHSAEFNTLMTYFYSWLTKIIFPIGMILALYYKRKWLFIFLLVAEIYLFMVSAHKTIFVALLLTAFYFFKSYEQQIRYFIIGLLALGVGLYLFFLNTGNFFYLSVIFRRVFFVPALLNVYYFDFFSGEELFLSHSIFKSILEYPYDLMPSYLIGKIYFNNPQISANNGFIADGFANFGLLGAFLFSFFTIIYWKIMQHLNISQKFGGIFIIIAFTMVSSAFFTSMLSHGLLIFLLIAMFMLQDSNEDFK